MEALVVGGSAEHFWALAHMLSRAGFAVDVVTASPLPALSRFTRKAVTLDPDACVAEYADALIRARATPYDWIILTDDEILAEAAALERRTGKRSLLMPLRRGQDRGHIYSKIGLSRALTAAGIRTPDYRVVRRREEAIAAAGEIGYPVFLKRDASHGGEGVCECRCENDLAAWRFAGDQPLLIQKAVAGAELDLSAIYFDGRLVHFSYSLFESTERRFGPYNLRRYRSLAQVDPAVFDEIAALGQALGAHGIANITAIEAADGSGRFYIEADMRPNVWIDYASYIGEDPAARIRAWFAHGTTLTKENAGNAAAGSAGRRIPFFLRLRFFELAFNRYGVWAFIPTADRPLLAALLLRKFLAAPVAAARRLLPQAWQIALRRFVASRAVAAR